MITETYKDISPAGLTTQGDNFLISYGSKDVSSHIAILPQELVFKSLLPIKH